MSASNILVRGGVLQIFFTTLLGWGIILPQQPWMGGLLQDLRHAQVTTAHVNWIVLALVKIAAAYVLSMRSVPDAVTVAYLIDFAGWVAPIAYFMQAWGFNGFRLDGKRFMDSLIALAVLVATAGFTYAWFRIAMVWWY